MELIKYRVFYITYIRQGNNRNGNPIYLVNIFSNLSFDEFYNINHRFANKVDKYGNIKIVGGQMQIKDIIKSKIDNYYISINKVC